MIVVPLVGAVRVDDRSGPPIDVEAGELARVSISAGVQITFTNVIDHSAVSFIHIWLDLPSLTVQKVTRRIQLDHFQNSLSPVTSLGQKDKSLHIGQFMGRNKHFHRGSGPSFNTFAFVIEGAFEVEDRLLQRRDGLALLGFSTVEFECLSHTGIILLLDL